MTTSGITVFGQPSQPNHGAGGRIAMDDAVFPTDYVALDWRPPALPEQLRHHGNRCRARAGGHIVDQFQQLVNPLRPIPRQIATLTGITDAMVADLDPMRGASPIHRMARYPGCRSAVEPIVGHNVSFDLRFLDYNTRHIAGCGFACADYDTMQISRACSPRSGITVWPT